MRNKVALLAAFCALRLMAQSNPSQNFATSPTIPGLANSQVIGTDPNGKIIAGIAGPATVQYASRLSGIVGGCIVTANGTPQLAAGGNCSNDQTALQNAIPATAPAAPFKLVLDGGFMVNGLTFPCNVFLEGIGPNSGLIASQSSTSILLGNGAFQGSLGAACSGAGIFNLTLNGNAGGSRTGLYPNLNLINISHVNVSSVRSLYATYFNFVLNGNVTFCWFNFNRMEGASVHQDGFHVDGPADNLWFSNNYCSVQDDCFAFNADENQGGALGTIHVTDTTLYNSFDVMRVYNYVASGTAYSIGPILVKGVAGSISQGSSQFAAFNLIAEADDSGMAVDMMSIDVSDVDLTVAPTEFSNPLFAQMQGTWSHVGFHNAIWRQPDYAGTGAISTSNTTKISDFSLTGFRIYRNTVGNSSTWPLRLNSGAAFYNSYLADITCVDEPGQSYTSCPYLVDVPSGAAMTNLTLGPGLGTQKINLLASGGSFARITNILGAIPWNFTVSSGTGNPALPSCTSPMLGATANVSDALTPTFLGTLTGGGSVQAPVYCNGSAWVAN